jgi:hypothetical protein
MKNLFTFTGEEIFLFLLYKIMCSLLHSCVERWWHGGEEKVAYKVIACQPL